MACARSLIAVVPQESRGDVAGVACSRLPSHALPRADGEGADLRCTATRQVQPLAVVARVSLSSPVGTTLSAARSPAAGFQEAQGQP